MSSSKSTMSLAVSPQSNALDGITLYESVDRSLLVKLINSTLLKTNFSNKIAGALHQNEKQQLERYLSLMENGRIPVTYARGKCNPYGRSNPSRALGLFPFRREIRHTLASGSMVDLDVKNCHPEMLNQLCAAEGLEHTELNDYVMNRQSYFDQGVLAYGCSEEDIKVLMIRYSYGGGFDKWVNREEGGARVIDISKCDPAVVRGDIILELTSFQAFKNSMTPIHKYIAKMNPDLCDVVRRLKAGRGELEESYNLNGSVCSFVLQEYEIRVLEQLFLYCSDKNLIQDGICVLCADGMMIERKFFKPDLLETFTVLIREAIGFNLIFTEKSMTKSLIPILAQHYNFDLYTPAYSTGLMAEHFAVMYSNKFMCYDGVVYQYNGTYWIALDARCSALHTFIDDNFHKYMLSYCANKLSQQSRDLTESITEERSKVVEVKIISIKALLNNIQQLRKNKARKELVNDIINQITNNTIKFDNDPLLFAFNNKIFDLRTNTFIPAAYSQYIRTTCGYDHSPYYSAQKTSDLSHLIDTIFSNPEVRDYYMTVLATGLYGQQIENFFIATGTGGNGKSLINALMMDTVGAYGYKLGANVLLDEIKEGANPAIASLDCKRFVLAQEPNGRRKICTATLKEITGDKVINARMNYSNNCVTKLYLTLVMECNELPPLDEVGGGVERRIRAVPFTSKAVSADTYHALADTTGYILANPYYKTTEFQQQHRQALFTLLLPYWAAFQKNNYSMPNSPAECSSITRDYLATSDDIYGWFSEIYERCEDDTSMIYIDEIYNKFVCSRVYTLLSKQDQRKFNKKEFNTKIEKNIFLKEFYKARGDYVNKRQLKKPAVAGFRLRLIDLDTSIGSNNGSDIGDISDIETEEM